jgi:hypothetical protein
VDIHPVVDIPLVDIGPNVDTVDIKPVDTVNTHKPIVRDAAYWRERKRAQRAAKALTATSSAA